MLRCLQAEINTWVVLSVALPGMTSDPNVMLPAASVGMLLAIGTAGLTVRIFILSWHHVLACIPYSYSCQCVYAMIHTCMPRY